MTHAEFRDTFVAQKMSAETRIVGCEPKTLGHEWRLFFVGGKIVGKTCYSNNGRDLPVSG